MQTAGQMNKFGGWDEDEAREPPALCDELLCMFYVPLVYSITSQRADTDDDGQGCGTGFVRRRLFC